MKLRWLMLACAMGSSWQARAHACSVVLPQKQSLACGEGSGGASGAAPTSVAQARLELDAVEIQRSSYPPPGRGDCGELGSTRLRFHLAGAGLAGNGAWPADVGVLLTLREGQSSYFAPPLTTVAGSSGWLLLPQSGVLRLFGPDDPRAPLALRLEARAVDCSGALSAPVEVLIADPGRADPGRADAAGVPDAAQPAPAAPEASAGTSSTAGAQVQASRTPPAGSSCAVCSVPGAARSKERGGFGLALLGALALSALRRRR